TLEVIIRPAGAGIVLIASIVLYGEDHFSVALGEEKLPEIEGLVGIGVIQLKRPIVDDLCRGFEGCFVIPRCLSALNSDDAIQLNLTVLGNAAGIKCRTRNEGECRVPGGTAPVGVVNFRKVIQD